MLLPYLLLPVDKQVSGVPWEPLGESLERGEGGKGDIAVVHHVPAALHILALVIVALVLVRVARVGVVVAAVGAVAGVDDDGVQGVLAVFRLGGGAGVVVLQFEQHLLIVLVV